MTDPSPSPAPRPYSRFETELSVRPDDIDLYQHVHSTRYLDYVMAARFDQMDRCYGMPMTEFAKQGLGWFMATAHVQYRRPLGLGDRMVVRTWIETLGETSVRVGFEIDRLPDRKRSCEGYCDYVQVTVSNGRPAPLTDAMRRAYSI